MKCPKPSRKRIKKAVIGQMSALLPDAAEHYIAGLNTWLKSLDFAAQNLRATERDARRSLRRALEASYDEAGETADDFEAMHWTAHLEDEDEKASARAAHARLKLAWEQRNAPGFER